jgi:GNAT superfamily N-acetyltransferase
MIRDLGDGLLLRRGRPADAEPVATFYADVLRFQDAAEPNPAFAAWALDLMTGRHPSFTAGDALVVEDRRSSSLVSCALLLTQRLSFAGVPLPAGQPELIGTRPEYRGRGLVRAMMETLHAWSVERGHVLQFIAGIPWFYRQFGYEMAIERGGGPVMGVDRLPDGDTTGTLRVRLAKASDVPFVAATSEAADRRYLLTVPRGENEWWYELEGRSPASLVRGDWHIVETRAGQPVAVTSHVPRLIRGALTITGFEVTTGTSWRAVWNAIVPFLRATGDACAAKARGSSFTVLNFWWLGRDNPLCRALHFTDFRRPEALYVRVPDLSRLLSLVRPVLERRLAESPMAGHTGELRIGFYRDGVRLVFGNGAMERIEPWRAPLALAGQEMGLPSTDPGRGDALFPGLTFLQLLFGFRALDEVEAAFPDCIVRTGEARALLTTLFPKQPSHVWPMV